jgi:hypothetical protein
MVELCIYCGTDAEENYCVCHECLEDGMETCQVCGEGFMLGVTGNDLGICVNCGKFFDLDQFYSDYDNDLVSHKGFDTLHRGILDPYRKN